LDTEEEWLRALIAARSEVGTPGYWDTVAANTEQWAQDVRTGRFWLALERKLPEWRQGFSAKGALLAQEGLPPFAGKGANRIKAKAFRDRAAKQKAEEALLGVWRVDGPPVPYHNDLVRTRVICPFLDGVVFFADQLVALAKDLDVRCDRQLRALPGGYFAQHVYFEHEFQFKLGGGSAPIRLLCEIQVATQLSTLIWTAAHPVYEQTREDRNRDTSWAWNPEDRRFLSQQLGHLLHLADGILVSLRNSNARKGDK
jgi:hypothetical protein